MNNSLILEINSGLVEESEAKRENSGHLELLLPGIAPLAIRKATKNPIIPAYKTSTIRKFLKFFFPKTGEEKIF